MPYLTQIMESKMHWLHVPGGCGASGLASLLELHCLRSASHGDPAPGEPPVISQALVDESCGGRPGRTRLRWAARAVTRIARNSEMLDKRWIVGLELVG